MIVRRTLKCKSKFLQKYKVLSVQFSCSVMSDPLRSHEPQHSRPPCPSPTPRFYPNSCPLSRWCHPTISSSVILFSSCLQTFPALGSFPMSQLFTSGGQSIGVSASTSVFPMNTQDWSPLGWTGWISLPSKGLSRVFSIITVQKHHFFWHSAFYMVQLSHPYMSTGKITDLTRQTFLGNVRALLFNMLSTFVIAFLWRNKCLNFMPEVTICSDFRTQKNKVCHCFHCFPIYLPWGMGPDAMILVFWMLSFKPMFSLSSFTFIKRLFSSSLLSSPYLKLFIFLPAIFQLVLHPAQHFAWAVCIEVK